MEPWAATNHADIISASNIDQRNVPTTLGPRTRQINSFPFGIPNPFCLIQALAFGTSSPVNRKA
jgi:hypothetical protein